MPEARSAEEVGGRRASGLRRAVHTETVGALLSDCSVALAVLPATPNRGCGRGPPRFRPCKLSNNSTRAAVYLWSDLQFTKTCDLV